MSKLLVLLITLAFFMIAGCSSGDAIPNVAQSLDGDNDPGYDSDFDNPDPDGDGTDNDNDENHEEYVVQVSSTHLAPLASLLAGVRYDK